MTADRFRPSRRTLVPTDVSQYLRLDRCDRYLRLRLYERTEGRKFLYEFDVAPQEIPPLLTRSGARFEARVLEAARVAGIGVRDFSEDPLRDAAGRRLPDNARLVAAASALAPGEAVIVAQARLAVTVGEGAGWTLRGDADLLRLARDAETGALSLLVADMKSSTRAHVEHRLQVAFYQEMVEAIFAAAEGGAPTLAATGTAVLYRGPARPPEDETDPKERERREAERDAARALFGVPDAYLEVVADPDAYRAEVRALVTGENSAAARAAALPFDDVFYALGLKCDGCLYNELCMKDTHLRGDLSLVPFLTPRDKKALRAAGVRTVHDLARLKAFAGGEDGKGTELVAASDAAGETLRRLAATTAGQRIDELVLRARISVPAKRDLGLRAPQYLPGTGHSTLPFTAEDHDPNLVTVYIDAQHDYLEDRVYLLGALVVAHEGGVPVRRESVIHATGGPPDTPAKEADLFARWVRDLLRAVCQLAAPDGTGERRAPIHLVFWNDFGRRLLLDALARNLKPMVEAAPALYDFVTQMAGYDSPLATFLDEEVRQRKNYPLVCHSLQAVAGLLGFKWDEDPLLGGKDPEGAEMRRVFRERLFDQPGKITVAGADGSTEREEWFARRSRHNSQIPLEFAYAAWGELPDPPRGGNVDPFAAYRAATPPMLAQFHERRLYAMEHVAGKFEGNRLARKTPFSLPDLSAFSDRADHLARALSEFVQIERHAFLGAWKADAQAAPERRVLTGETLLVRYDPAEQEPGVADRNRDNERRRLLQQLQREQWLAANPGAQRVRLPAAQKAQSDWSMEGMPLRLRLAPEGVDADFDTLLGLMNVKEGERFVLCPRRTVDERLPEDERSPFTPTPKQMLYGTRAELKRLVEERDPATGRATGALAEVEVCASFGVRGSAFLFPAIDRPLEEGALYTLDPDPNDTFGFWNAKVCDALVAAEGSGSADLHPLYARLAARDLAVGGAPDWPADAQAAQERFFAGLEAFEKAGLLHGFESSKRAYIEGHGADPVLLVQGPPGTGKSYTTAFAVLARLQGALAAGLDLRVFLCCKTHAATNVLLRGVADARETLEALRVQQADLWDAHFDARLLTSVPLLRVRGGGGADLPEGVTVLAKDSEREKGEGRLWDDVAAHPHAVFAATPGGVYGMVKDRFGGDDLLGHPLCDLLVLDEASQLSLPEAMMASLPLAPGGRLVVVGDPRQMPPIVQHAWETERRQTFRDYRAFDSLFDFLKELPSLPFLRFEESFRLHAAMARFLRDEVYLRDGIDYHSRRTQVLADPPAPLPAGSLAAAALDPEYPLVVLVHGEEASQARNPFEERLVGPLVRALTDPAGGHGLGPEKGLGVVVPHRAQRAALLQAYRDSLCVLDPATGEVLLRAVDTVERYQGDEREVILVSATESDPEYLSASAGFLLDPRRLTVALSRARRKMILVASRSIFDYFSSDDEMFLRAQMWKNLLRRACTTPLWSGTIEDTPVTAWGCPAATPPRSGKATAG